MTANIAVGTLIDLRRNRRDLIVEHDMLRQQRIVFHRQVKPASDSRRQVAYDFIGQDDPVLAASNAN